VLPLSLPEILVRFVALVLSLSFHEAAHAWTSNRLGDPTARLLGRLTLNPIAHIDWIGTVLFPLVAMISSLPIIGWAKPVPVNARNLREPRKDFALVALAGPVSNLILATSAALLRFAVVFVDPHPTGWSTWLPPILANFVALNVLLAIFNIIPVPPLDGGNVLMGVLPGGAAQLFAQIRPWGFLILYVMMFSGVLWAIIQPISFALLNWLL
jgi:Zn-dependent protease